jgi:hypothetical protein
MHSIAIFLYLLSILHHYRYYMATHLLTSFGFYLLILGFIYNFIFFANFLYIQVFHFVMIIYVLIISTYLKMLFIFIYVLPDNFILFYVILFIHMILLPIIITYAYSLQISNNLHIFHQFFISLYF